MTAVLGAALIVVLVVSRVRGRQLARTRRSLESARRRAWKSSRERNAMWERVDEVSSLVTQVRAQTIEPQVALQRIAKAVGEEL